MIDSYFRNRYQAALVTPIISHLVHWNFKPYVLTLIALCTGLAIIPALGFGYSSLALSLLLMTGYFDTLDGSFARATEQVSNRGAVLDIVSDRVVEFAIILGLYLVSPESRGLLCLLMLGSVLICVTSFLVVSMFIENQTEKSFFYSPGLMERSEAFITFGLMIVLPDYFVLFGSIFFLLVAFTGLWRVVQFFRFEKVG